MGRQKRWTKFRGQGHSDVILTEKDVYLCLLSLDVSLPFPFKCFCSELPRANVSLEDSCIWYSTPLISGDKTCVNWLNVAITTS